MPVTIFLKIAFTCIYFVCVYEGYTCVRGVGHSAAAEVRGELVVVGSLLPCGFWGWNSGCLSSLVAETFTLVDSIRLYNCGISMLCLFICLFIFVLKSRTIGINLCLKSSSIFETKLGVSEFGAYSLEL